MRARGLFSLLGQITTRGLDKTLDSGQMCGVRLTGRPRRAFYLSSGREHRTVVCFLIRRGSLLSHKKRSAHDELEFNVICLISEVTAH